MDDPFELDYDAEVMAGLPGAYRIMAYSLVRAGFPIRDDLYSLDQPERVSELYRAARAWLGEG